MSTIPAGSFRILKCDLVNINNKDLYHEWIDGAVKDKKSESGMRLTLRMTNPTNTAKLSHQDGLLAKWKAMMKLRWLKWTQMNGTTVIFTCELYTTSILSDPNIRAPPKSLRYKCCRSSSQRKKISDSSQDPLGTVHLAQRIAMATYHPALRKVEIPIIDYLKFLRLARLDKVHDILTPNDIDSHKIFASTSSLDQKEVLSLGLTLGVVTKLFDNVVRFDKYISRNNSNNV
ncbi:hypothetical protein VP01_6720g1 [Puccinia sorghi]|uniref:Uncharacterized protein n=1 Tax=Puccinia sorghi TaxID=27349 RepID=A0A0L6UGX5_9BASI|nr:hypothetical protein VP01_6720g1 [Puccinia sorghi]